MNSEAGRPCVFLDRDGVLIEDRPSYVQKWGDVEILPRAVEGCRLLAEAGFALVVITNQALVGRGLLSLEEVQRIHQRIVDRFGELGAPILASYLCPHRPEDDCECRKPKPGMILRAAAEHGLDLGRSFLIGDSLRDLEAAEAAGVRAMLVLTGRGEEEQRVVTEAGRGPWPVYRDLLAAAKAIKLERA